MCYYTLTLDHVASDKGHTRAIMIIDAKSKTEATAKFLNAFGVQYYNDVVVTEGIHVENGFDRLLTEHVKKYILKAKSKSSDAPLVSYQNMINLKDVS
jgi:precorrin-6B methylase 1